MTYKDFVKTMSVEEDTLAFTFNNGGTDETILISGSSSQLKRVKKRLPTGTKLTSDVPDDALEISASDWLKIK